LIIVLALFWSVVVKASRLWQDSTLNPVVHGASLALIILFVSLALLPGNLVIFFLLIVLLAITEKTETKTKDLGQLGGFIYPLMVFPLVIWGGLLYLGYRQVLANHYYYQSIVAAAANDGIKTYNLQSKAIGADPSSPAYRWAYAQTNLALANAIASQATKDKPLTDEQRNNISQLIQQTINEAKSTVALDPRSAAAWENLAATYRSLINFAQGADQWSIDSYQQAIALDPLNPRLRLDFGSLYYGQKKYDLAANLFSQAVSLKSDYANAHYNLAAALKELGQYQLAANAYQNTLSLVPVDSQDFTTVNSELEAIKKYLPTPTPTPPDQTNTQSETLTKPVAPPQGIN
ncbi:MAG: tetratricopeptide repeat protein, partial [Candidatus Komeilibacteria bacterium]|nr:tetratricopeptide repeat protein [Candidatus Komeilibacteria bacterium]